MMNKVAYVIDCMYNSGGMERVLTVCANALADAYEITIISAFQGGRQDYFTLKPQIRRHDLGIGDTIPAKEKKREYRKRLSDFLKNEHFNTVVSLGGMDFDFLHAIRDGSRKMVWFHFAINIAETTWAGPNPNLLAKIKAKLQTCKRIYHGRKYNNIVVISKADLHQWQRFTNRISMIYNPVTITPTAVSDLSPKRVISVGRLDFQKGYDFLIDAWKMVVLKHPDWRLDIFGEGPLRQQLQEQIERQGLSDVVYLKGRSGDISREYVSHSVYVMSSRAEGFPLVLMEAASCGLPLVSFDCPSGPSEIIENGKNGFLIDRVGDVQAMAERICQLMENESLRRKLGHQAKVMASRFSIERMREDWMKLFLKN